MTKVETKKEIHILKVVDLRQTNSKIFDAKATINKTTIRLCKLNKKKKQIEKKIEVLENIDNCECGHSLKEHNHKEGCMNQAGPKEDMQYRDRDGFCVCVEYYKV